VSFELVLTDTKLEDDFGFVLHLRVSSIAAKTAHVSVMKNSPALECQLPQLALHERFAELLEHLSVNHCIELENNVDVDLGCQQSSTWVLTKASSSCPKRSRATARR
jgi:hypothetical protein